MSNQNQSRTPAHRERRFPVRSVELYRMWQAVELMPLETEEQRRAAAVAWRRLEDLRRLYEAEIRVVIERRLRNLPAGRQEEEDEAGDEDEDEDDEGGTTETEGAPGAEEAMAMMERITSAVAAQRAVNETHRSELQSFLSGSPSGASTQSQGEPSAQREATDTMARQSRAGRQRARRQQGRRRG